MTPNLEIILTIAILLNVSFGFLLLYFIITIGIKKSQEEELLKTLDKAKMADEAKEKSFDLLGGAIHKANKILSNAELKGIKIISEEKLDARRFTEEYHGHMKALEANLTARFEKRLKEANQSYIDFVGNIEKSLQAQIEENQKDLKEKTVGFIASTQSSINTSVSNIQNEVKAQLQEELDSARTQIEDYKKRRIDIIDQNIVEILEKTLSLALGKKLTLNDQSELIYKALDEAKREHALT